MNRSDLIEKVAERWELPDQEARHLVDFFFESIARCLERDERLELRGFGTFEVKHRESRTGRIPGTGETVDVPSHKVPDFKPGKVLKKAVRCEDNS
ncbi:MAG: HU family DNA-binding protein [bacterium]